MGTDLRFTADEGCGSPVGTVWSLGVVHQPFVATCDAADGQVLGFLGGSRYCVRDWIVVEPGVHWSDRSRRALVGAPVGTPIQRVRRGGAPHPAVRDGS